MPKFRFLLRSDKPAFHAIPKPVRKALRVALISYVGACLGLAALQRQALFHPTPAPTSAPPGLFVWIEQGDARFWVGTSGEPQGEACKALPGGDRLAVAYFGGNSEAPSDGALSASLAFPGCLVYSLAYPGYDGAPGQPSQTSIHAAADAMVERMVRDGFARENIIMAGRSLGAGEAVRQASKGPCFAAYLATPYDSLAKAAQSFYPWAPVSLLMLDRFDATPWARQAQCPAAALIATEDRVISPDHAYALVEAWNPAQPTRAAMGSGGHGIAFDSPAGLSAFADLNRRVRAARQSAPKTASN